MNQSQSITNLAEAMANAQAEFPPIQRTKEVTVVSRKTGTSYSFTYTPLDELIFLVRPVLAKHGLSFMQGMDGPNLITTILHKSGEFRDYSMKMPEAFISPQELGSELSYRRRYCLALALGVASEEDDDGQHAARAAAENKKKQQSTDPSEPKSYNVKKDAFERMKPDEQEFLRGIAANVIALLDEERADDAYGYLRNQKLDTEEQVAIQHLFDSKQRSALAKAGEHYKAVQNAGERAKHQQSRPAAQGVN